MQPDQAQPCRSSTRALLFHTVPGRASVCRSAVRTGLLADPVRALRSETTIIPGVLKEGAEMARRILRIDSGVVSVAREAPFESERQLHSTIAQHPEVLPSEDVGLGPLVVLANELDLGAGPMDLLAVDAHGRLAIVEFKRGTENPEVRKVTAQMLDYGSSLWRLPYEELERSCRACSPGFDDLLSDHVEDALHLLGESYDEETFLAGISRCLQAGSFVFMYVARDLDERTRRIMTFLSDGARMTFFAVEVDYFQTGEPHTSVMIPRTSFVPSWLTVPSGDGGPPPPPPWSDETRQLIEKMDELAKERGLSVIDRRTGRVYLPRLVEPVQNAGSGIGVYSTHRGLEMNLSVFRAYGEDSTADRLLAALGNAVGIRYRHAHNWPSASCARVLSHWDRVRDEVLTSYFEARSAHAGKAPLAEAPFVDDANDMEA